MSLTLTVTPVKQFTPDETVDTAKLNQLAQFTVSATGAIEVGDVAAGAIDSDNTLAGPNYVASNVAFLGNLYTLTLPNLAEVSIQEGTWLRFIVPAASENTGPVTITIEGCTPPDRALYKFRLEPLVRGDLRAGQAVDILFDGTQWQMMSPSSTREVYHAAATTGTVDAPIIDINPLPDAAAGAQLVGKILVFKTGGSTNAGPMTLSVTRNAGTPVVTGAALVKQFALPMAAGDVPNSGMVAVVYDGTKFQMINAPATFADNSITGSAQGVGFVGVSVDTMRVSWTEVVVSVSGGIRRRLVTPPTGSYTLNMGSAGAVNRLDVGVKTASTCYHIWAISTGVLHGVLASLSSSAPTMPVGYVYKAYLGAFSTSSSGSMQLGTGLVSPAVCFVQQIAWPTATGATSITHGITVLPSRFWAAWRVVAADAATLHATGSLLDFSASRVPVATDTALTANRMLLADATSIFYVTAAVSGSYKMTGLTTALYTSVSSIANFELVLYAVT